MITIKESINNDTCISQMLTEALFEKHMQRIVNQFTELGANPKDLFSALQVAFDKLDASHVKVYRDTEDKECEKAIIKALEEQNVVFGIKNGLVCVAIHNVYDKNWRIYYLPTKKGDVFGTWSCMMHNPLDLSQRSRSSRKFATELRKADEVWIVNTSKLGTTHIQADRSNAQTGVWTNTPEFYAKVLENNLKRYKNKIAKMRSNDDKPFEEISKQIEEALEKSMKLLIETHKNCGPGQYGANYQIKSAIMSANSEAQRLVSKLGDIVDEKRDYEAAKELEGAWRDSGYAAKNYQRAIQYAKQQLEDFNFRYNNAIQMIEDFKKNPNNN